MLKFLKLPFRLTSGILFSLEKLSDKIAPHNPRKKVTNAASGLLIGTSSVFKQLMGAIAGLALEPYKGAKKMGLKGAFLGLGKGLVGLVVRPIAGSIDLITYTARGVGNTPGMIYRNLFRIY